MLNVSRAFSLLLLPQFVIITGSNIVCWRESLLSWPQFVIITGSNIVCWREVC